MFQMPDMSEWFNLGDYMLDRHIREGRGNKTAIYYRDQVITYGELQKAANKVGNALLQAGVEEENRVMICLPDCPEFLYVYFGAMRIGAIPVPISTMALPQDYKYFLNDGRGKALVTNSDLAPNFVQIADELRYLRHFIVVGDAGPGQRNFYDFIKDASDSLEVAKTSKDDMAFWLYSSGTTGQPKGVVHMHHDVLHFMPSYNENVLHITEDDIIYSASKMYFSYGRNTMEAVFMTGAASLLMPELPKPEVIVETISRYKPTIYFSVPTSYMGVLDLLDKMDKEGAKYDLSSLRMCISAGEALPKVIFDRWKDKFGVEILDGIGSTDVGGIYISSVPGKIKSGSCGVLLPGFNVKLTDDAGNPVPDGEIGVLWMNNDGSTPFYWRKHDKTKEAIVGEWFNTGDQFVKDSDGFYWFSGRADDMLKAGGIWVSPVEVENTILEHPAVLECGVVGFTDDTKLEKPLAFVVLREGFEGSPELEDEIKQHVRSRISSYKCPRWIRFAKEFPRTATGKMQRYKLRALLQEEN